MTKFLSFQSNCIITNWQIEESLLSRLLLEIRATFPIRKHDDLLAFSPLSYSHGDLQPQNLKLDVL